MQLSLAMLYVKDFPAMSAFYGEILGLNPVEETRSDTWLEFATGATRFALHAIPPHIAGTIEIGSPPRPREDTPIKLFFRVADLQAEYQRLKALGVRITERPWGDCDGIDPEGNIFSLTASSKT